MPSLEERDAAAQAELVEAARLAQAEAVRLISSGEIRCDFCAWLVLPSEVVTFEAEEDFVVRMSVINEDLSTGHLDNYFSAGWAACPSCATVVESGDAVALADHAVSHQDPGLGVIKDVDGHRSFLLELYAAFFSHNPRRL